MGAGRWTHGCRQGTASTIRSLLVELFLELLVMCACVCVCVVVLLICLFHFVLCLLFSVCYTLQMVPENIAKPYEFELFHPSSREPLDLYQWGNDFFRPLVELEKSRYRGSRARSPTVYTYSNVFFFFSFFFFSFFFVFLAERSFGKSEKRDFCNENLLEREGCDFLFFFPVLSFLLGNRVPGSYG